MEALTLEEQKEVNELMELFQAELDASVEATVQKMIDHTKELENSNGETM